MKKAFIHAYCQQNLGDDMFVKTLVRRYKNVKFIMRTEPEYSEAFLAEPNLILKNKQRQSVLERIKHAFFYDAFIKIGGSIFMEPKNWRYKKPFAAWQCKILNRNKFIVGANFGPYYTKGFYDRAYSSLRYYRGICFRDSQSYELFSSLSQVMCAPDILFGYPNYPEIIKGNGVGISVIYPERKLLPYEVTESYYEALAIFADSLIEFGIPVRFLGFCRAERDDEAISCVLAKMKYPWQAESFIYNGKVSAFLERINECETIIASRFHAMIIGFALKKKVLPVIYSSKQLNVLCDLGFTGPICNLLKDKITAEQIMEVFDKIPTVKGVEALACESKKQFLWLDKILK